MIIPARDPEYPSQIWVPPQQCPHRAESLCLTGSFPPDNPDLGVFDAHCLQCGSAWTHEDTTAPWDQLMRVIAEGRFGVVSWGDEGIAEKVERRRRSRYDAILNDAATS